MTVSPIGKFAAGGFFIIWLMNKHGVIPDASSTLWRALWNILMQNCYSWWDWIFQHNSDSSAESMTWKHPHSPVKKKFNTVHSPGKVIATVFTPPGSTTGNSKDIQRGYWGKTPGLLATVIILLHDNSWPHNAAATMNHLNFWDCEILPHPPYCPDLALFDFHLFPKKNHLKSQQFHSSEDVQN